MKKNIFNILKIKSVDEEKRIIKGIATTPTLDRQGDIVVPEGVVYSNYPKLMLYHDHEKPVGNITNVKVTSDGIEFEAEMPIIKEDGHLKDRIDEAWQSLKYNLISAVSIGFRTLEYDLLKTGGWKIKKWEWLELSLVPIPAQPDAVITGIKSLDDELRSASKGNSECDKKSKDFKTSDSAEKKTKTVKINKHKEINKMAITEQLKNFRATLAEKRAKLIELAEKSVNETFDDAQKEEFDTLESEIEEVEGQIKRLEKAETLAIKTATAVTKEAGESEAKASEARTVPVTVKAKENTEKGIDFARYAMCLAAAKGNASEALHLAKHHYGNSDKIINVLDAQTKGIRLESIMHNKAAVAAGTTVHETWAGPLVDYQNFAGDFIEFLRPRTILGQFGQGSVPQLRRIPFNVKIQGQTSGGSGYWVGEGAPKPLTKFDFAPVELRWTKVANIAVLTEDLIRFSNPSAERLVRDSLADACQERLDTDFINPAFQGTQNVSPDSILYGATNVPSTGGVDADAVRQDLKGLWQTFIAAKNPPKNAVYVMNSTIALSLSLMQNALGQPEFSGITMNGGMLLNVPVIVSDYVPEGIVALVNASDVYLADDGQFTIDASREASLQMLNDPTNNSAAGTATTQVSMFQTNSVAIRVERYINWARRRASGTAYLSDVNWGGAASS